LIYTAETPTVSGVFSDFPSNIMVPRFCIQRAGLWHENSALPHLHVMRAQEILDRARSGFMRADMNKQCSLHISNLSVTSACQLVQRVCATIAHTLLSTAFEHF
jgi:hypothetical protein